MLTDEPGPLGLLRTGQHAARTAALPHLPRISPVSPAYLPHISRISPLQARTAALRQAARHFEASAAPAAVAP